ncbi:MAG: amidohydrolase family protein [Candidatus Aminicenantales bacterium]
MGGYKGRRLFYLGLCMIMAVAANPAVSYRKTQENAKTTAITDVRVFDASSVLSGMTVVFSNGVIREVGRDIDIPSEAEIISGKGCTLLPGLIDAHVHVLYPQVLKQMLIFGITGAVDMSMDVEVMKNIKRLQNSGKAHDMAHLISAGSAATVPGGHGTQFGDSIPTLKDPEDVQAFVDARLKEGSDFIKIMYDDGTALSKPIPTLDRETLAAVVRAAHKRGRLAVVHVLTLREAREAIEAGVDGLAHLFCEDVEDDEFGRFAAARGVFVIPTLTVLKSMCGISDAVAMLGDRRLAPFFTPADAAGLKRPFYTTLAEARYRAAERAIRQLKEADVPILAGTDVPNPGTAYGASLHHELSLLVRAGLTPREALASATSVPAKVFKLERRGWIRKGYAADLVLVKGDPTEDITATRAITAIWKDGVRVDRRKYLSLVEREKKQEAKQKNAPPPPGSESGWISDFESEEIGTFFGSGWTLSTDALMGGKCTAEFRRVEGGANRSQGSMLITGTIWAGVTPWAGVMFFPAKAPMAPANLSAWKAFSFWAKGEGEAYTVMIFARSFGFSPAILTFVACREWEKFTFPFERFGTEGHDIWGIFIGGPIKEGPFALQIDDVRLEKNEKNP